MGKTICPGQDTAFWRPGDVYEVPCSNCGEMVEFFKDDATRRCGACKQLVRNPRLNLGCAQWCEHAKECLGYDPKDAVDQAGEEGPSLFERLKQELRLSYDINPGQMKHAEQVMESAREIMKQEGGDPRTILAAALLHQIHGLTPGEAGAEKTRSILKQAGLSRGEANEVIRIMDAHNQGKALQSTEALVVWDADLLSTFALSHKDDPPEKRNQAIERLFLTDTGKKLAAKAF